MSEGLIDSTRRGFVLGASTLAALSAAPAAKAAAADAGKAARASEILNRVSVAPPASPRPCPWPWRARTGSCGPGR